MTDQPKSVAPDQAAPPIRDVDSPTGPEPRPFDNQTENVGSETMRTIGIAESYSEPRTSNGAALPPQEVAGDDDLIESMAAEAKRLNERYAEIPETQVTDADRDGVIDELAALELRLYQTPARGPRGVLAKLKTCYTDDLWRDHESTAKKGCLEGEMLLSLRRDLERLASCDDTFDPRVADIETLAAGYFRGYQAYCRMGAGDERVFDEGWACWIELTGRRPETPGDAAALLSVARNQIVKFEGDTAGVVDEPWIRDLHDMLGRVQTYLMCAKPGPERS